MERLGYRVHCRLLIPKLTSLLWSLSVSLILSDVEGCNDGWTDDLHVQIAPILLGSLETEKKKKMVIL